MARVVRDGAAERIPAGELVPGDVVHIEAGDFVPADLRLLPEGDLPQPRQGPRKSMRFPARGRVHQLRDHQSRV